MSNTLKKVAASHLKKVTNKKSNANPVPLEKDIELEILNWLNTQPDTFAFKVATGGYFDSKRGFFRKVLSPWLIQGTSDIVGVKNGRMFVIEVKRPKGRVTQNQIDFIARVRRAGGLGEVCYSLKDVQSFLWGREVL